MGGRGRVAWTFQVPYTAHAAIAITVEDAQEYRRPPGRDVSYTRAESPVVGPTGTYQ